MKNKLFQNRQKVDGANRLRSAESASDIAALNQTAELSSETDRPMFEGSPEQSYEESPEPRNSSDQSSFNIFSKPKADKSRSGGRFQDMTSSTPSPTPPLMPTLEEEPSEAGQPMADFEQMHSLRAKRKDEDAGSSVPERKQQVMTETQLAMLQTQFFAAESEKIQNLIDDENKR